MLLPRKAADDLIPLRALRDELALKVAAGMTPLEALSRLHAMVDFYNLARFPNVRNWGKV